MKITIDEKICLKHKMTLPEVLLALAIRAQGSDDIVENLVNREILIRPNEKAPLITYLVTQHWSDVLDEIISDSGGNIDDDRLLKLAEEIQKCYPQGFKRDERTGTKYYHKSNKVAIKQALKRFITNWGDVSDEDIIDATKRYVASFKGNYNYPFQMANYFVCKDNRNKGGELTSSLATFLENKESEEEEVNTNEDWTIKSRN